MYFDFIYKLYNNRLYLYLIYIILFNIYEGFSHIYLLDDGSVSGDTYGSSHEAGSSRPSHTWGNRPVKVYKAYAPNYVETSQGWRTELPNKEVRFDSSLNTTWTYSVDNSHESGSSNHTSELESTKANYYKSDIKPSRYHSEWEYSMSDHYQSYIRPSRSNLEWDSTGSHHYKSDLEPTRSHLERNGIYAGQAHSSPVLEYCDKRSKFANFKDKFKSDFKRLEKKIDSRLEEEWAKRRAEEERFRLLEEIRGRKSAVQLRHRNKRIHPSDFGYKYKWTRDFIP